MQSMSEIIFGFHSRNTLLGKVRRMRRRSSFVPASDRRKELLESPVQTSKDNHSSTAAQTLTIVRFSKDRQRYHKPSALQLCLISKLCHFPRFVPLVGFALLLFLSLIPFSNLLILMLSFSKSKVLLSSNDNQYHVGIMDCD
uniref:Transmembrane protein n=1 Tax=Heterorhabditis bacteriophora TaxID=37862 RepID=A0A1I7WW67_HETBA